MCVNLQNVITSKCVRAGMILTCTEEVPSSNLAQDTHNLEVLHVFPHSLQENFRTVDLPYFYTSFQIHYSLSSNHLMPHTLVLGNVIK